MKKLIIPKKPRLELLPKTIGRDESMEIVSTKKVSLGSLLKSAIAIDDRCSDWVYPSDELSLSGMHTLMPVENEFTQYSVGQLCNKLRIPVRYFLYLTEYEDSDVRDLARENVNRLFKAGGSTKYLIRSYEDNVRGFLTDKYARFDSHEILDVISDVADDFEGYEVKGSFLTPERFHLRLIYLGERILKKDDLYIGMQLDSSDVGRSAVSIKVLVYKLACTNGLMLPIEGFDGFYYRGIHKGFNKVDSFREAVISSFKTLVSLKDPVGEILIKAKDDERRIFSTQQTREQAVSNITVKTKGLITGEHAENVYTLMDETYGFNAYGFSNALTEVAQEYTLERRIEIEKFAGQFLYKSIA